MLRITHNIVIPYHELEWQYARSGGPGGQNVNKVSSKALLRWRPGDSQAFPPELKARLVAHLSERLTKDGDLLIASSRFRNQLGNVNDCLAKLAELLRAALHRPKARRATKPTRGSQERRLHAKRQRARTKAGRRMQEE
jgi:ribosome-associated protein